MHYALHRQDFTKIAIKCLAICNGRKRCNDSTEAAVLKGGHFQPRCSAKTPIGMSLSWPQLRCAASGCDVGSLPGVRGFRGAGGEQMARTKPGLHETTSSLPSERITATTEWLTSDQDGSTAADKPSIGFRGTERGPSPVRTRRDAQNRILLQPHSTEEPGRHGIHSWFQSSEEPLYRTGYLCRRLTGASRPGGLLAGLRALAVARVGVSDEWH
jgi:hypothetical protein